ncbi:MAG: hypothetical protein M3P47_03580 [Pseudomonadota bacterium]|nr:hypothetical protein [Pseudomonadota bacterium]
MRTLSQNHCAGILPNHILKKRYTQMDISQKKLDEWLDDYNKEKYIKSKVCNGRTPLETLPHRKLLWNEKFLHQI